MVKLVDFGLAEVLGTHSFAGGAGTYAYMAPEDFHEEEQSDRQSDIWAVGVILYEMLAGRRPFQVAKAKDPFAWKRAVEEDRPAPDHVPAPGRAARAGRRHRSRALAKDKRARYADAADMARDLRALGLARQPPTLPSPPLPHRNGRRARGRTRWRIGRMVAGRCGDRGARPCGAIGLWRHGLEFRTQHSRISRMSPTLTVFWTPRPTTGRRPGPRWSAARWRAG